MLRSPVVAGQFYTDDAASLRSQVENFLEAGTPQGPIPTLLCMVPHAGYIFSGAITGLTLGLANLPETLLLLGPNHTGKGAKISLWSGGDWQTPLGNVQVDTNFAAALVAQEPLFSPDTAAHLNEHSLEVVLPFLQVKNQKTKIIPIAFADSNPEVLARTGAAIARCIREYHRPVGIIVSSDMSHYLPQKKAQSLDALALEAIKKADPEELYTVVRENNISMCGVLSMTAALVACRLLGVKKARVTRYATSGDVCNDMQHVVGYAGVLANFTPSLQEPLFQ